LFEQPVNGRNCWAEGSYWSKSFRERRNDLEAMIEQSEQGRNLRSGGKGPTEKRMLFNGMRICANTWCVTHRISRSVWVNMYIKNTFLSVYCTWLFCNSDLKKSSVHHSVAHVLFVLFTYKVITQ
jgi:hypothetical protein